MGYRNAHWLFSISVNWRFVSRRDKQLIEEIVDQRVFLPMMPTKSYHDDYPWISIKFSLTRAGDEHSVDEIIVWNTWENSSMISLRIPSQRVNEESFRSCLEINVNSFWKVILNNEYKMNRENLFGFTLRRFLNVHSLQSSSAIVRENQRILLNQYNISPEWQTKDLVEN